MINRIASLEGVVSLIFANASRVDEEGKVDEVDEVDDVEEEPS